jgi:hypothetical protein
MRALTDDPPASAAHTLPLSQPIGVQASMLAHVPELSHLHIHVGSDRWHVCKFEDTSLAVVIKGVCAAMHSLISLIGLAL